MELDNDLQDLLNKLQEVAKKRTANNRSFTEFTGLIGELAVCKYFDDYTWNPDQGYDAKDKQSKERIQIKTRRLQTSTNFKGGRLSRFGSARTTDEKDCYDFDLGNLVVLDYNFNIAEIWTLDMKEIQDMEAKAKERKKQPGKDKKLSGLNLSTFINNEKVTQHIHGNYPSAYESLMRTYRSDGDIIHINSVPRPHMPFTSIDDMFDRSDGDIIHINRMPRRHMPFTSIDDMFDRLHMPTVDGWEKDSQWKEGEGEDEENEEDEKLAEEEFFGIEEDEEDEERQQ